LVEDRIERHTVVTRFKNAAVGEADVENKWIARIDGNVRYATAHHRRADRARFQVLEKHVSELRCRCGRRWSCRRSGAFRRSGRWSDGRGRRFRLRMKSILLARCQLHHYEQNTEKRRANGHSEPTLTKCAG